MSTTYRCSACNKHKGPKAYSKSQLSKNKYERRCKRCIQKATEVVEKANNVEDEENDRLQDNMAALSINEKPKEQPQQDKAEPITKSYKYICVPVLDIDLFFCREGL